jgi:hypothetical protein
MHYWVHSLAATTAHIYKPLGLWTGPYLAIMKMFVFLQRIGAKMTFYLGCWAWKPPTASNLHYIYVCSFN